MSGIVVRCIHEFQAETDTDLSILSGDIIKITNVISDDWYEGVINNRVGQFPKAFVEECHDVFDLAIVISSFSGEEDGDLTLQEGELVVVTDILDENWLSGYVQGGRHGVFPKDFVKLLAIDGDENVENVVDDTQSESSANSVVVLYDFKAQGDTEISLKAGEMITILSEIDEFWCEGKSSSGEQGIFPRDFVDLPLPKEKNNDLVTTDKSDSDAGGGVDQEKNISVISNIQKCIAEYDFISETEGDLSFVSGDEIALLEVIDDNWCRGELDNRVGIFPRNYVKVLENKNLGSTIDLVSQCETAVKTSNIPSFEENLKKKPDRPKLPTSSKKDYVPFCYQFKTDHQPTVIIPPWKLKSNQQNILLLGKRRTDDTSALSSEGLGLYKTSLISPSASIKDFRDDATFSQYEHRNTATSINAVHNVSSSLNQNAVEINKRVDYSAFPTGTAHFERYQDQLKTNLNADKMKSCEKTVKKEYDNFNKNIPRDDMSTYQKMKCANNNLNTVVTVANAVGIKTTKTQVAKGAVKMGASAYVTGSKSSNDNKATAQLTSAALKGFARKK